MARVIFGDVEEVGSTSTEIYTPRRVLTLDAYIVVRQLAIDRHHFGINRVELGDVLVAVGGFGKVVGLAGCVCSRTCRVVHEDGNCGLLATSLDLSHNAMMITCGCGCGCSKRSSSGTLIS